MAETATVGELLVRIRADVSDLERGLKRAQGQTQAFSTRTAPGINKLQNAFRGLAFSVGTVPGPLGRAGSALLMLGTGGAVTLAVLAGIAAIGGALKLLEYRASQLEKKWKELQLVMQFQGVHERTVLAAIQSIIAQDPVERIKQVDQAIRSLTENMRLFQSQTVRRTGEFGLLEDVTLPGDPEKLAQVRQAIKLLQEERNRLLRESTANIRGQKEALLEAEAALRKWDEGWAQWDARARARGPWFAALEERFRATQKAITASLEQSREVQEAWTNFGYAIGDYFMQGFAAATSGGLGGFLKSLGFTLLRGVIFGAIAAGTGGTFAAGFGAGTGIPIPGKTASKVGGPSLGNAIDFSGFPPARNPLAAARDRDWQTFFRESGLVAAQGGFR